jgi:hypothetical protein
VVSLQRVFSPWPRVCRCWHFRCRTPGTSVAALQDRGFTEVHLAVARANEAAIGLYRSIGFCEIEERDE